MLTHAQIEHWRETLLQLRDRLDGRSAGIRAEATRPTGGESSGGISNQPIHMADLGSQEAEKDAAIGMAENEAFLVGEIEAALDRIRENRFGLCEDCVERVGAERLSVIPYARHCIECARRAESGM